MNKATFVTSVYYDLYQTEFNGRTSRELHYLYSLRNILNTNANVKVYTSDSHVDSVKQYIGNSSNTNVDIVVQELKDTTYYNFLKDYKKHHTLDPERCYEIMYSKTKWLRQAAEKNTFNSEWFYWIDAGLSHHGLFPQRFRRNDTGDYQYDMWYNYNLFNGDFVERVLTPSKDKLFSICIEQYSLIQYRYVTELFNSARLQPYHFIGGIFGGSIDNTLWFCREFSHRLHKAFNLNLLLTEEQIYTSILHDNIERFDNRTFNTWYYKDPNNPIYDTFVPHLNNITPKSFYEIFL